MSTPFEIHGALSVSENGLFDQNGEIVQLRGVSTSGLQWYPEYVSEETIRFLRDDWNANLLRLAMYTDEGGYCDGGDTEHFDKVITSGADICTQLGMYCIIDWHILHDGNPLTNMDKALDFFERMSKRYSGHQNILYEICNEPNGDVTWADVKKYADTVIPVIRNNAPDAVILVGSTTWSQDVDLALEDPVAEKHNVMYTLHFYAGTHKDDLRGKLTNVLHHGLPVFISEFSICDASGNGALDYESAQKWMDIIKHYNLSVAGWSLCNRDESSAYLRPESTKLSDWTDSDLNEWSVWYRGWLRSVCELTAI